MAVSTVLAPAHKDRVEWLPWLLAGAGLLVMYVPTLVSLFGGLWAGNEQGHGPLVLGVTLWLLQRRWAELTDTRASAPQPRWAWPMLVLGALAYAVGRSQGIWLFEVGSSIVMVAGIVLLLRGPRQLKAIAFALFFMAFMIPLPGALVDALTQPMKLAVSSVAEDILYALGYPISRSGVILQIGPYQLLVADACAGLHTLFTLEALGLLYLNVVRHASLFRNVALAAFIVPIGFAANVIRVMALTLITFHFGDAAGQGFLHGFAGIVLFLSALMLVVVADSLLRFGAGRFDKAATA